VDGIALSATVQDHCKDVGKYGYEKCLDVCQEAECCFDSKIECGNNLIGCDPYDACDALLDIKALNWAGGRDAEQPEDATNSNTKTEGSGSGEPPVDGIVLSAKVQDNCKDVGKYGYEECLDVCQEAECCFDSKIECGNNLNLIVGSECDPYDACEVLLDIKAINFAGGRISDTKTDTDNSALDGMHLTGKIEEACADITYATARQDCLEMCQPSRCCFNEDIPCDSTLNVCDPYDACEILLDSTDFAKTTSDDTSVDTDNGVNHKDDAVSHAIVEDACRDIGTFKGHAKCLNVCKVAECCFEECDSKQTPSDYVGDPSCVIYDACQVLIDEDTGFATHEDDFDEDEIEEEAADEQEMEFEEEEALKNDNDKETDVPTVIDGMRLTGKVEALCANQDFESNGSDELLNQCLDICEVAECCFDSTLRCGPELIGCDPYDACEILMIVSDYAGGGGDKGENDEDRGETTKEGVEQDALILNVCSPDNLASKDGLNACREACGFRACCFAPDEDNCYNENVSWCQAYGACEDPMKSLYDN
jgi:hypothetical protein